MQIFKAITGKFEANKLIFNICLRNKREDFNANNI
jgi:hypothetical protein